MFYNERYWTNKADRAIKAREHTRRMYIEFGEYIKDSVAATKIYGGTISDEPVVPITETVYKTEHVLADLDSVSAVLKLSGPNICVHNFASYRNPGGRFIDGSKAQEECLCHGSFLYNVLNQFSGYYAWNEQTLCRGFYDSV